MLVIFLAVLGIKIKALHTLGKYPTTELHFYPSFYFLFWVRVSLICLR